MKQYTHVIWDFNGTVYNDVDACIRSANRLLTAHGLTPFSTVTEYRERFGFPIIDYYRRMGFDFDVTPYDELAVEWVDYYMEETSTPANASLLLAAQSCRIHCDLPFFVDFGTLWQYRYRYCNRKYRCNQPTHSAMRGKCFLPWKRTAKAFPKN